MKWRVWTICLPRKKEKEEERRMQQATDRTSLHQKFSSLQIQTNSFHLEINLVRFLNSSFSLDSFFLRFLRSTILLIDCDSIETRLKRSRNFEFLVFVGSTENYITRKEYFNPRVYSGGYISVVGGGNFQFTVGFNTSRHAPDGEKEAF